MQEQNTEKTSTPRAKFLGMSLFVLSLTCLAFTLFIFASWELSDHQIFPSHKFYPWKIKYIHDGYFAPSAYETIINPFFLLACALSFICVILIYINYNKNKLFKIISILALTIQIAFILLLAQMEWPLFAG